MHFPHNIGIGLACVVNDSAGVSGAAEGLDLRAREWLKQLAEPHVWCRPEHRQQLIHSLGRALYHAEDFPDVGLMVWERDLPQGNGVLELGTEGAARGKLVVTTDRATGTTEGDFVFAYLVKDKRMGGKNGIFRTRATGQGFFQGLEHLLRKQGRLFSVLQRNGEPPSGASPHDQLRRMLVRQLEVHWPQVCRDLAREVRLESELPRHHDIEGSASPASMQRPPHLLAGTADAEMSPPTRLDLMATALLFSPVAFAPLPLRSPPPLRSGVSLQERLNALIEEELGLSPDAEAGGGPGAGTPASDAVSWKR